MIHSLYTVIIHSPYMIKWKIIQDEHEELFIIILQIIHYTHTHIYLIW